MEPAGDRDASDQGSRVRSPPSTRGACRVDCVLMDVVNASLMRSAGTAWLPLYVLDLSHVGLQTCANAPAQTRIGHAVQHDHRHANDLEPARIDAPGLQLHHVVAGPGH